MACLLCESAAPFRRRFVKEGWAIEDCPACGLTQLNPAPTMQALQQFYEGAYFHNPASSSGYDDYAAQEAEYLATFQQELARISPFVRSGRALDIGCGYGYFMKAARDAGFDVYGIDVSRSAIEVARRHFGNAVAHGGVEAMEGLGVSGFELIFASHVIEHVLEPVRFVKALSERLSHQGVAVFVTPNIESVLARASGRRWVSFKVPEHVAFYSPSTLARLMDAGGMETLAIQNASQYYSLPFVARRLRELTTPIGRLIPPVEQLAPLRNRIVRVTSGSIRLIARRRKGIGSRLS